MLVPETQPVTIRTNATTASIRVDGVERGRGMAVVPMSRRSAHTVEASFEGETQTQMIGRHLSPVALLDVIGAIIWLVPIVGLAGPGSHDLDTTMLVFSFAGGGELPPLPEEPKEDAPYTGKGPPKDPFDKRK